MTTISDLDLSKITQAINSLKQQLPPENERIQILSQRTLLWTATVQEAKTWLAVQQCLQLIETEEQKAKQINQVLNPVLENIKEILQAVNLESKIVPATSLESQQAPVVESTPSSHSAITPNKQDKIELDENNVRQYCWELAHCSRQAKLNDSIEELNELRQQTAPAVQPQIGDIVLHGTVLTTSSPIWIAPIKTISAFSQLAEVLPFINLKGQIWLDFSDIYTVSSQHLDLPIPKWCRDYPDTHLLWHRWIDLLYWTIIAPDYSVFVTGQKAQQLSIDREIILKTLLTIHKDFEKGFNEPEKYVEYLGYNLHKLYAVFHQFLDAEDMVFDTVPKHVFANLRRCVDSNIGVWQKQLTIHEEHPIGPLNVSNRTRKEYLAGVISHTDNMNNIQLPLHHPFSQKINAEKNQVLYWTKPFWKQSSLSPTHHYFDLKGSVLYCYT
ncbi:hypothetical protein QUF82_20475 [Thiotrichales bacterium HSG14]|nr:hypothetical protein [Thiotrichales bacterium HSG14]